LSSQMMKNQSSLFTLQTCTMSGFMLQCAQCSNTMCSQHRFLCFWSCSHGILSSAMPTSSF
jgi:hypothetical protein